MRRAYMVLRAKRAAVVIAGLVLCLGLGALGGLAKAIGAWSVNDKHPIYFVDTDKMQVSLGINCAWGDEDIPELLAILKRYKIKATFFIVGEWCDKFPQSVKAIDEAGHEIGSHSDTHADMTKLDDTGVLREIRDSSAKLQAVTGKPVKMFRVPSGAYNSRVIELIEQEGMYPIQWDCDSIDYEDPSPEQMLQRILKNLKKGSIMLFHSGAKNTPAALPLIIETVTGKGYKFVALSELVHPAPYSIDHEGRQRGN